MCLEWFTKIWFRTEIVNQQSGKCKNAVLSTLPVFLAPDIWCPRVPIAVLVPKVALKKRIDVERLVAGRIPRLAAAVEKQISTVD